jgi:hypothetical protein
MGEPSGNHLRGAVRVRRAVARAGPRHQHHAVRRARRVRRRPVHQHVGRAGVREAALGAAVDAGPQIRVEDRRVVDAGRGRDVRSRLEF